MLAAALHNYAAIGVAALILACMPLTVGYGPALLCIGVSVAFIAFICISAQSLNQAVTKVSGFAQPDARSYSSLDSSSLRFGSPTICFPDLEDEEEKENEFFNITSLRRSVAACFTNIKPRRGRYPSEDSTAALHDTPCPPEPLIPINDTARRASEPTPRVAVPTASRRRAMTLPAPPRDRPPSFSGFAFPPREPEPELESELNIEPVLETLPQKPSRPKLSMRIPSTIHLDTLKSSTKPSPSPAMPSPCSRSTSVKSRPLHRYLRSLRGLSVRSKREGSATLTDFDGLELGPLQRSTSVEDRSSGSSACADFMVRCVTVAA